MAEQTKNFAQSYLTANATSGATTLTVGDGSNFSSPGRIAVETSGVIELMTLTNVSGNTLTVTRGQGGTSAAAHNIGELVSQVITKEGFDAWLADARIMDTYANIPSAGSSGRFFIASDGCTIAIDDGAAWNHFGPIFPDLTPPIDGDFSWVNQGSATIDTTRGGVVLKAPASGTYNVRARYKALTAPYKVTMHFVPLIANANSPHVGIGFRSSASSKAMGIHVINSSTTNTHKVEVVKLTDLSTYSSSPASLRADNAGHWIRWLQIEDNNTNLYFRYSCNGKMWITAYLEARGTFFSGGSTPTGAFFYANANNASFDAQMHVKHWLEQ